MVYYTKWFYDVNREDPAPASRRRRRGGEAVSGPPDALQDLALFLVGDVMLDPGVLAQLRGVPGAPQLRDRSARALGRHRQVGGAVEGRDRRERRRARLRAERRRRVERWREQTADGEGGRQRLGVGDRQGEGHDAALREAGDEGLADGGAGGYQGGERGGDPIRF